MKAIHCPKTYAILHYLKKLALVFWLGEMLFFAIVYAPRVFKVLPRDQAALLQNNIFPSYFNVGIICSAIILIALLLARPRDTGTRKHYLALGLTIFCGLIFIYSRFVLVPEISSLQSLGQASEEFKSLHVLSVRLNGCALLGLLVLLGL